MADALGALVVALVGEVVDTKIVPTIAAAAAEAIVTNPTIEAHQHLALTVEAAAAAGMKIEATLDVTGMRTVHLPTATVVAVRIATIEARHHRVTTIATLDEDHLRTPIPHF